MKPTRLLPVVALLSLVTVEYGGWALLGFLTGAGALNEFQEQFFRAGHAHAGVLLVLSLVYFMYLAQTTFSEKLQWVAGVTLLVGILCQSGGFFLHLATGAEGSASVGTLLTRFGALLLAAALVTLAVGLLRGDRVGRGAHPYPAARSADVQP